MSYRKLWDEYESKNLQKLQDAHLEGVFIAGCVAATRWIPVSELLPIDRQQVLFLVNGKWAWIGVFSAISGDACIPNVFEVRTGARITKYRTNMVTHWQPMPQMP